MKYVDNIMDLFAVTEGLDKLRIEIINISEFIVITAPNIITQLAVACRKLNILNRELWCSLISFCRIRNLFCEAQLIRHF